MQTLQFVLCLYYFLHVMLCFNYFFSYAKLSNLFVWLLKRKYDRIKARKPSLLEIRAKGRRNNNSKTFGYMNWSKIQLAVYITNTLITLIDIGQINSISILELKALLFARKEIAYLCINHLKVPPTIFCH